MLKAPRNLKNKLKFEAYTAVETIEYFTLLTYHKKIYRRIATKGQKDLILFVHFEDFAHFNRS